MGFDCILLEGDFSSVTEINAQVQTQFLMSLERFRNLKYTELEIVGVKNRVQHQCGPASWASSRSFSILGDLICDHQGHTKVWNSYSSWSGPHLLTCSESCVNSRTVYFSGAFSGADPLYRSGGRWSVLQKCIFTG